MDAHMEKEEGKGGGGAGEGADMRATYSYHTQVITQCNIYLNITSDNVELLDENMRKIYR